MNDNRYNGWTNAGSDLDFALSFADGLRAAAVEPFAEMAIPRSKYDTIRAHITTLRAALEAEGRQNAELVILAQAFVSYLEDDSRSPRRRMACLEQARAALAKVQKEAQL